MAATHLPPLVGRPGSGRLAWHIPPPADPPLQAGRGRRGEPALSRGLRSGGCLGCGLGSGLALFAGNRPLWIAARGTLAYACGVEETQDTIGRCRSLGEPALGLVDIEFEPLCVVLRQQRIEIAEPLDETAVTRRAAVGHNNVIDRPLLGAGSGHPDFQRHRFVLSSTDRSLPPPSPACEEPRVRALLLLLAEARKAAKTRQSGTPGPAQSRQATWQVTWQVTWQFTWRAWKRRRRWRHPGCELGHT